MNSDSKLIFEAYTSAKPTQTLANGSKVIFHKRDLSFREFPNFSQHDLETIEGQQGTIEELATATELGEKDFEYYDVKFDNGQIINAISGYHLDPIQSTAPNQARSKQQEEKKEIQIGRQILKHVEEANPQALEKIKQLANELIKMHGTIATGANN